MRDWREMSRDELETQFSPSRWSHRMSADDVIRAHVDALRAGTEKARSVTQTLLDVPYGDGDGEKLDVYVPSSSSPDVPLVIYFHGGYWQFLSKEESGFLAVPLVQRGVVVVAVGYSIAPKGTMDVMVSEVRRSVVSVVQQYSHISALYLCGHSAGAHLAAMVLSTDWTQYGISPPIKGAFLVSGIYDLQPILSTYVNEPLKMRKWRRGTAPVTSCRSSSSRPLPVTSSSPWRRTTRPSFASSRRNTSELWSRSVSTSPSKTSPTRTTSTL
ncbi:kynurenine formamidase isoform X2 [Puntigrus tetrazona]|uniref:kynurenine formamidase isoform X2 n=1 Tax=Puntigrus tetrazona TaxID=1606681 RepID=UPI001C8A0BFF|nr:kynurenine formamidase isoform X2 [Puntigrus tetrazona]